MKMKKTVSLLLTVIMVFSLLSVFVPAGATGSGEICVNKNLPGVVQAPSLDGNVAAGEYGEPIYSFKQGDATLPEGVAWVKKNTENAEQTVNIYMANDKDYLYIAATMDHATQDTYPSKTNGTNTVDNSSQRAMLAVTASRWDDSTKQVQKDGTNDKYVYYRMYANTTELNPLNRLYHGGTNKKDVSALNEAGVSFQNGTYTYEIRIKWTDVPGLETGYTGQEQVALTMRLAEVAPAKNKYGSYYTIGGDAKIAANPSADGVLVLTPYAAGYVKDIFTSAATTPVLDNVISEAEYGEPVMVGRPTDPTFTLGAGDARRIHQRASVYMSYDDTYLYVAATLTDAVFSTNTKMLNNKSAMLSLTLSKYDETTKVLQGSAGDQYFIGRFSYNYQNGFDKNMDVWTKIYTGTASETVTDVAAKAQFADSTYTYEIRIPWTRVPGMTAKDVQNSVPLAATVRINDGNVGTKDSHEGGCYLFGGDAVKTYGVANPHDDGVLKLTPVERSYMLEAVKELTATSKLDSVISEEEYGEPILVSTPADSAFTLGKNDQVRMNQRAKVYMTYDDTYLYVAATLTNAVQNTNPSTANNKAAMFSLTLSKYDSATQVLQDGISDKYFIGRFSFNSSNTFSVWTKTYTGANSVAVNDVGAKGQFADGTYTYEARIPWTQIPGMTAADAKNGTRLATTIRINDGNLGTGASHEGGCYLFGGDAVKTYGEANPHSDGVVALTPVQKGYAGNTYKEAASTPKMDSAVSETEYGQPILVATPDSENFTLGKNDIKRMDQRAKVYMTYDDTYLYVAATLSNARWSTNAKMLNNQSAMFSLTLSRYDETANVLQDGTNDKYFIGRFSYNYSNDTIDNALDVWSKTYTGTSSEFTNVAAKGKFQDNTYTYEVRIPWTQIPGMTAVDARNGALLATTIRINDGNLGTDASHEGGCYLFGGDAVKTYGEVNPHSDGVLALKAFEKGYVKDAVSELIATPEMDGTVTVDEWGQPIIVTNADHCKQEWKGYWKNDAAHVLENQTVKVYSTNDDEYIYFAVTIDEADLCTLDGKMYEKAHVFLTIGRYDQKTDMERIQSQNKTYERCIVYRLGFDGSVPKATATGIKVDRVSIGADDWAIRYDAQTRTYTYELRVPFTMTTLRYGNDNKMNVSIAVADARHSMDKAANVYNIGGTGASYVSTAADNFAHTDQSMMLKLNDNPYAKEGNWSPVTEINPATGDLAVWAIVPMFAASGIVSLFLIAKRRKMKD